MEEIIMCPLLSGTIPEASCRQMRKVFEETRPIDELVEGVEFTDQNQQNCLQCEFHSK